MKTVDQEHAALVMHLLDGCLRVRPEDREDVFAAGLLGLAQARARFDPRRQVPFAKYARRRILGSMVDELRARYGRRRKVHRIRECFFRSLSSEEARFLHCVKRAGSNQRARTALRIPAWRGKQLSRGIKKKFGLKPGAHLAQVELACPAFSVGLGDLQR